MRIAFIGDLHLDNKNTGQHKDYYKVCIQICDDITDFIQDKNITHIFFAGDLTNKNISEYSSLNTFLSYFAKWNGMLNGNVYSIRGNHDYGAVPRMFQLLETAGLIKTKIYDTDTCGYEDIGKVRVHFMNYGETEKHIDYHDSGVNILLSHSYWITSEQASEYKDLKSDALIISECQNIQNIDYIMNGHIHTPTDEFIYEKSIKMINLGCPSRPAKRNNIWNKVYFPYIDINNDIFESVTPYPYLLPDTAEIYKPVSDEANKSGTLDVEELRNIFNELRNMQNIDSDTLSQQVYILAGDDKETAELVISALEKCSEQFEER